MLEHKKVYIIYNHYFISAKWSEKDWQCFTRKYLFYFLRLSQLDYFNHILYMNTILFYLYFNCPWIYPPFSFIKNRFFPYNIF